MLQVLTVESRDLFIAIVGVHKIYAQYLVSELLILINMKWEAIRKNSFAEMIFILAVC